MRTFWSILTLFGLLAMFVWLKHDHGASIAPAELAKMGEELDAVSSELKGHSLDFGRYPSNDEGVGALWLKPPQNARTKEFSKALQVLVHQKNSSPLKVSRFDKDWPFHCFLPTHDGLEDPHGIPLGYENRKGFNASKFKPSPLNDVLAEDKTSWILVPVASLGKRLEWWRKVDDDIYIYSLAGRAKWLKVMAATKQKLIGFLFISVVTLLLAYMWHRAPKIILVDSKTQQTQGYIRTVNWVMGSLLIVTGLVSIPDFSTCYQTMHWWRRHEPNSARAYVEMVDGFHARGVIRTETAQKLKKAASRDDFHRREEMRRKLSP